MSDKRKRKADKRAARKEVARKKASHVQRDGQGRAHLVVHRDALGRTQRLTLARPLFNEKWQNDITAAAASTAHGLLSAGRTVERSVAVARSAMSASSKLTEGLLARSPERELACRAGCSHCCYQSVGVLAPEVLAIHDHLVATRTPAELEATVSRIREAEERTRGLNSDERLSPELPCPFLESGRCSIYEVRPLACRGKNSLDAAACERTLREPESRARFLAGSETVPCFLEPLRATHAITAGLELALEELHRLAVQPLELTSAMRILLDDPENVPRRWLAGEDPFQSARGGDATDNPHIAALSGRLLQND